MSELVELLGGRFVVDRDATAKAYSRIAIPGPEECACLYCRNWVAGRERVLPSSFRRMLLEFGVPPNGEIEVWHVPGLKKPHGYGGWYTVVGQVLKAPADGLNLEGWAISIGMRKSYGVPAFAQQTVFELHFFTEIDTFIAGDY